MIVCCCYTYSPAKCSVSVDNLQRIKGGVHHLCGGEEVLDDGDAEVSEQYGQTNGGGVADIVTCMYTQEVKAIRASSALLQLHE